MSHFENQFDNLSEQDRQMMETDTAYIKAREKAESFLADIDPDLEVDVQESLVTPNDTSKEKYSSTTLRFSHKSNPFIHWTMEIGEDDEYKNEKLETGIRKIYQEQNASVRELMESWPWYETARQKAESFLPNMDPDLFVSVEKRTFTPDDPKASSRNMVVLRFQHRTNPKVNWTMNIDANRNYIDDKLQEGVRKIYQERKNNWLAGDN